MGYINYDYAIYDREDGIWYGTEDETYMVDSFTTIKAAIRYYYGQNNIPNHLEIDDIEFSALYDAIE